MVDRPQSIDEIRKHPKMMAAFLAHAKEAMFLNEVLFYFDKGNAQALYPKYIDQDAAQAANLTSKVVKAAKALADKGDWSNKDWAAILKSAKAEVAGFLVHRVRAFPTTKHWKEFVLHQQMGDPAKAAKLLGIKDVKKLKAAMEHLVLGETAKGKKLLDELAKKEKLAARSDELVKALAKSGLA